MNNLNQKETAQEGLVQEQYTSKCMCCNKVNEFTMPIKVKKLPGFCMYCGEKNDYIKKGLHLQE